MTLSAILAVQFPRRSLIVYIPVAGISNFHVCIGEVGASEQNRPSAINLFPLCDTRRIIILHLRCQITMVDNTKGWRERLKVERKKNGEDGELFFPFFFFFLSRRFMEKSYTRLRKTF